jgi:hypothetical protein
VHTREAEYVVEELKNCRGPRREVENSPSRAGPSFLNGDRLTIGLQRGVNGQ